MDTPSMKQWFDEYYRIKDGNGNWIKPTISDYQWEVFLVAEELDVPPFIRYRGRKQLPGVIVNPVVSAEIEKRQQAKEKPTP